jgi:ATP-binding cassette subfamily B (MDR/TAP) protein 1
MGLSEGLTFITYFVTFWYGGKLIADGEYTFLDVMKVLMAIIMSAMAVGQTSAIMPNLKKAKVAASHVFRIIDAESPINPVETKGATPQIDGKVELRGAEFFYPTRKVHV